MRRLEVRFQDAAIVDLDTIFHFVLARSASELIAQPFIDRLIAACERIGDAPRAGRPHDDLELGLRTRSFESRVLIAYRIDRAAVLVASLFYKGRDVEGHYARLGDVMDER